MRNFLFLRHPLSRRTLMFCHLMAQLGLMLGGAVWLVLRSPWLAPVSWEESWPTLALGAGLWLLAIVGVRLLVELMMLPHHLAGLRQGFAPSAVVTRSFEQRPAVHDPEASWVNKAKPTTQDDEVIGSARVMQPRRPFPQHDAASESTFDRADDDAGLVSSGKRRQEPSL